MNDEEDNITITLEELISHYETIRDNLTDWYIKALNDENRAAQKIIYRNYEIADKILKDLYKKEAQQHGKGH